MNFFAQSGGNVKLITRFEPESNSNFNIANSTVYMSNVLFFSKENSAPVKLGGFGVAIQLPSKADHSAQSVNGGKYNNLEGIYS